MFATACTGNKKQTKWNRLAKLIKIVFFTCTSYRAAILAIQRVLAFGWRFVFARCLVRLLVRVGERWFATDILVNRSNFSVLESCCQLAQNSERGKRVVMKKFKRKQLKPHQTKHGWKANEIIRRKKSRSLSIIFCNYTGCGTHWAIQTTTTFQSIGW